MVDPRRLQDGLYRTLIQNSSDTVLILDADGVVHYASPSVQRHFGYPPESLVGRSGWELIHPEDVAAVRAAFGARLRDPDLFQPTLYRLRHRDGSWRSVETVASNRLDDPTVEGVVLNVRDVTKRVAAEEENRRLAAIVAASDDAIFSLTLDGTILSWNAGAERIYGYAAGEAIGASVSRLIPPERRDEAADLARRLRQGEHVTGLATTRLRKDGRRIHLSLTLSPIRDEAGRISFLSIIARDIGERVRAGEELRASNERYRLAGRATKDVIWDWKLDTDLIEWGEAICTTFGYRREEVRDDPAWWSERIHPDDRERVTASLADFFGGEEEAWSCEYRFLRADGSYANVLDRGYVIRTPEGRVARMIGSLSDLTTQKESEDNLAAAHARLRHLLAASPTVLYVLPITDGRPAEQVTWVSDNASRVLKTPPERFMAPGWWRASVHPDDQARVFASAGELFDADYRVSEYRVRLDQGGWRWMSDHHRLIRDAAGEPVEIIGAWTDVTERREAEEALLRAKDAAEAASRSKSEFLSSMSHELRTPLNSVIGFTNVLSKNRQGTLREQELAYLERIHANGLHLLGLINDILDLSKIEAGKLELEVAPVALDALIQETIEELQGNARPGVDLSKVVPERLDLIETDSRKLKQILINLVGNALKFTETGSVRVEVIADPRSRRPLRVEVRDTGVGIRPDRLDAVFQAFEQAESGTARRFGGTGLGLAISASLAQLLGFRIEAESELGAGSTFRVVLAAPSPGRKLAPAPPAATAPLPDPLVARGEPGGELRNRAVLIVDDEPDSRFVLSDAVAEFGCDVVTASTGEHGLRLAREIRPDLIILDLLMPGLSGWETLRALKEDPELRGIPVVVVSVLAEEQRGSLRGVADLLNKPHDRTDLLRILRRNLGAARRRVLVVDDQEGARLLVASCIDAERAPASPAVTILTKNGELEAELGRELREIWRRIHPDEPPRTRD